MSIRVWVPLRQAVVAVTPVGDPPVITSNLADTLLVGAAFSYTITATGTAPVTFGVGTLPAWLSFDTPSGTLTGVSPGPTGPVSIDLTATNAYGSDARTLEITVVDVPTVTSASTVSGDYGAAFTYQITATNSPTTFFASGLPAGLSLDSGTGLISGTPVQSWFSGSTNTNVNGAYIMGLFNGGDPLPAGDYRIEYVSGAIDYDGPGGIPATLYQVYWPPASWNGFATLGPHLWYNNLSVSQRAPGTSAGYTSIAAAEAANAGQGFNFTHTGGQIGVRLEDPFGSAAWSGDNTGAPFVYRLRQVAATVTAAFDVWASNAYGEGAHQTVTLTLSTPAPVITSAAALAYTAGTAVSYQITATNNPHTYGATGLPSGLTINTGTGLISGTIASGATTYTVTVSATNDGGTDTQDVTIISSVPEHIWWKMNETSGSTLTDSGANGKHATLFGTYAFNGGLDLNGAGYAESPVLPSSYRAGAITYSVWAKTRHRGTMVLGGYTYDYYPANILSNDVPGQGGNGIGANIWTEVGGAARNEYIDGRGFNHIASGQVSTDWEHLVYTYDPVAGMLTIYKNGAYLWSQAMGGASAVSNSIKIGRHNFDTFSYPGDKSFYFGTLKDARVYSRSMTASEAAALYALGPVF